MIPSPESLNQRLETLGAQAANRLIVAFSGGLDSTVLLHLLSRAQTKPAVLAVHVNHGLQAEADQWQGHCIEFCNKLGVECRALGVDVDRASGQGPEAAAREARYAAFEDLMADGDCLLLAHHRDDQAETLLINLMRSSGPLGLAAMPPARPFGPGRLLRPLLLLPRSALLEYAEQQSLSYIEDPSNSDTRLDRNFIRHRIMPGLQSRWPDTAARLARSSELMAEASTLLDALAQIDLERAGGRADRLEIDPLTELDSARCRNLLRYCLRRKGLAVPGGRQLASIYDSVVHARADAEPLVQWPGGEARRYREHLFLLPPLEDLIDSALPIREPSREQALGGGLGTLRFELSQEPGLQPGLLDAGLEVRFREGGETLHTGELTRPLKKLLQESGVVPWMRHRIPLLYAGEQLVAVADLWMDPSYTVSPGLRIHWENHAALD